MKRCILLLIAAMLIASILPAAAQDRPSAEGMVSNWMGMDKNGDGKLAKDETDGLMESNFDRNDADKDGFLVKSELEDLARRLSSGRNRNANRNPNQQGMSTEALLEKAPEGVKVVPDIAYREGNEAWKLDLAMPAESGDAPLPTVVFIHGGGWRNGDKRTAAFIEPMLEYAAKGYVSLSVNYRLGEGILPCVEDVKCAMRWLRAHAKEYNVDPERVGAAGNSAGAHLAVMLAVCPKSAELEGDGPHQDQSSAVQAALGSATPTMMGGRDTTDEDMEKVKPMSYVRGDVPPIFLVHEESDRTVPVANSDDFDKALREAGAKDITYKRFTDGSGHGVFQKNIEEMGPAREAFFARVLKK